jgi:hypothetical protein
MVAQDEVVLIARRKDKVGENKSRAFQLCSSHLLKKEKEDKEPFVLEKGK